MEHNTVTACSLSSSSSGNSIYITDGETSVLIDAGLSARRTGEVLAEVGSGISKISAIFVTHEHIDHVKGLSALCSKFKIPVFMTKRSFESLAPAMKNEVAAFVNFIPPDGRTRAGNFDVYSFKTPHDSSESVGYAVFKNKKKAVAVATDIGEVTEIVKNGLLGADIIFIESNHDLDMLRQNRNYPEYLKARIRSKHGHLSNPDCAEVIPFFLANGTKKVMLYHLSSENNKREIAFITARISIVDSNLKVGKVFLGVAPKDKPSVILSAEVSPSAAASKIFTEETAEAY